MLKYNDDSGTMNAQVQWMFLSAVSAQEQWKCIEWTSAMSAQVQWMCNEWSNALWKLK